MRPIDIIKDSADLTKAQAKLRDVAKLINKAVTSRDGYGFIKMTPSEKEVVFPILEGLQIPFSDQYENGVCVGDDFDKVQGVVSRI